MSTLQRLSLCVTATLLASLITQSTDMASACIPPAPEGDVDVVPASGEQVTPDVRFFVYYQGTENAKKERYSW